MIHARDDLSERRALSRRKTAASTRLLMAGLLFLSSGCLGIGNDPPSNRYEVNGVEVSAPFTLPLWEGSGLAVFKIEGKPDATIFLQGDIPWDPGRLNPIEVHYFAAGEVHRTLLHSEYPENNAATESRRVTGAQFVNTSAGSGLLTVLWSNLSGEPNITIQTRPGGSVSLAAQSTDAVAFDLEAFSGTAVRSPISGGVSGTGHADAPISGNAVFGVMKVLRPLAGNGSIKDDSGTHPFSLAATDGAGYRMVFVGSGKLQFDFQAQSVAGWRFVVVLASLDEGVLPPQTWVGWNEIG